MSLISRGASWLAGVRATENAHDCVYVRRSPSAEIEITAGIGQSEVNSDTYDRATIIRRPVDFLIERSALRTDPDDAGTQFEPKSGDIIRSSHTGTTREYLVSPDFGEAHAVPHTGRGECWRVHTKEIS
jgi:hypothetical protein